MMAVSNIISFDNLLEVNYEHFLKNNLNENSLNQPIQNNK